MSIFGVVSYLLIQCLIVFSVATEREQAIMGTTTYVIVLIVSFFEAFIILPAMLQGVYDTNDWPVYIAIVLVSGCISAVAFVLGVIIRYIKKRS